MAAISFASLTRTLSHSGFCISLSDLRMTSEAKKSALINSTATRAVSRAALIT